VEKSAIVYHGGLVEYDFGPGHPFRGDRFTKFMRLVEEHNLLSDPNLELVEPSPADDSDLLLIHSNDYIREVERRAELYKQLTGDTPLSPSIVKAARLIVGASLKAGELVAGRSVKVAEGVGGGLHHAGRGYGGGFCVFNDVAMCVQSLLERHGMDRVLVFDTDVHAGNGTMDIFYEELRVLFVSVHQDPRTFYPGTGFVHQTGSGEGEGYTVNIPLPRGAGDDCMSLVIEQVFEPLVSEFRPQAIVRNGGSDPHFQDLLGGLSLTYSGLRAIGEAVADAARSSNCGVVDLCCSGYNPATVAEGWLTIMSGVMGMDLDLREGVPPPRASEDLLRETQDTIDELRRALGEYWSFN
jgi:acetoin utilization protein AcuC